MAGSIYSWSQTADDNDDADGDINWQENQLPDTVNNSARVMMKRGAEYIADQGTNLVGGTADALTLTAKSSFTAYANGLRLTVKAASTNTTAVTFNVNSLGNKAIRKVFRGATDVALGAGDLQEGGVYELIYDAAANSAAGAWILINPALGAVATGSVVSVAQGGTGATTASAAMATLGAERTITAGDGLTGAGTLAADRTIALGTPSTLTASTTNALTADSHTHEITGFVPTSTSITAGSGLTGGGDLSANRTITMGTPGSLSTTSTNAVSSGSHTHALEGVVGLFEGTGQAAVDFPIGHSIFLVSASNVNRNATVSPALNTDNNVGYVVVGAANAGTALDGTWRGRGRIDTTVLAQRVA